MSGQESTATMAGDPSVRMDECRRRLADDIDLARFAPGQVLRLEQLAKSLRIRLEDIPHIVSPVLKAGLLTMHGNDFVVAPIDRGILIQGLDQRLVLEQHIAASAAGKAAGIDRATISDPAHLLKRSALVGDIDGYMAADRRLEKAIAKTAELPMEAEQLFVLKREFRRAWCAYNRLRDLNRPAALRQALVDAILAGDPVAARTAVKHFIDYLRQSY